MAITIDSDIASLRKLSKVNSSIEPLGIGEVFEGEAELNGEIGVFCSLKTDKAGKLYYYFSNDRENWDIFPSGGFDVAAGGHEVQPAKKYGRWFKVRFENTSGAEQTYFRLYTYYGDFSTLSSPLETTIPTDAPATIVRAVLTGKTDGDVYKNVPVTSEGHPEFAIHEPLLPFGSVHVENLTPIFQADAVYLINPQLEISRTTGAGSSVTVDSSLFVATIGTVSGSQAVMQSRKRLRYRAGQGSVGRFTAMFDTPIASSYQLAGFGHAGDGCYVGYGNTGNLADTRFGILYVRGGFREIKTLTISTGATSSGNVTITLNGTPFTVAVTNASNVQRTVWEISQGTYAGWDAFPSGATVVFVRNSAGTTAGTQTFNAGTTGAASSGFVQTRAGVDSTDTFIAQEDFNGDVIDGTGASGFDIDPQKLNIYQISYGYLGTDSIVFRVKVPGVEGNNSTWVTMHTIQNPNSRTTPIFTNPSFPFTMAVYSAGSTGALTLKSASYAGFIEGAKMLHGGRFTYYAQSTAVTDAAYRALFTVMNKRTYAARANQAVINMLNISGAIKHTSPVVFYLIRSGTLVGNPNFTDLATSSCSSWDTAATTVTWATGDQLLATFHVGDTGEFDHHFGNGSYNLEELTIQPGEYLTLAARATTGSPSWVTCSINTREDQ